MASGCRSSPSAGRPRAGPWRRQAWTMPIGISSGTVSASDALAVVNYLNAQASQSASPEGEADEFFSSLGDAEGEEDVLSLLADDLDA